MKTFDSLWAELNETARNRPENSGTIKRLDAGIHEIGKKIVEEAAEVWMAAEHQGKEDFALEVSQLIYHLQVMMIAKGVSVDDIYKNL
jgi:phosphoribosyl-ATP pyrophosphohydrolase